MLGVPAFVRAAVMILVACGSPPRSQPVEPLELHAAGVTIMMRSAPPVPVAKTPPERCSIRLHRRVITVDGDPLKRAHAVSLCKARGVALVEVADEASATEWRRLRAELEAAGVRILIRGTRGHDDGSCLDNPLAKGCVR